MKNPIRYIVAFQFLCVMFLQSTFALSCDFSCQTAKSQRLNDKITARQQSQGNYNSSGADPVGDALGGAVLGLFAIYAFNSLNRPAQDSEPVSHKIAKNSRAAGLAEKTLFLPNLKYSVWFDDSGHAVTLEPQSQNPVALDWRVKGDTVCLYKPYTKEGNCMQLSFDTASGLINGVRLTGGGVETNIQTVSLDIDNHGAKIQSILPPKPAPKPEPLPTPQAVASQTGSTLHKAHTQDVGGLYTTSAAGVDAPAKPTNTNNNLTEFVENVVSQDARNWAVYRFNRGTVRNAKITHENGSEKTIYGDFTYSGLFGAASPGWVKIKVKNGQVDCVLFWDEGGCRSLGFTPSMAILGASAASATGGNSIKSDVNSRSRYFRNCQARNTLRYPIDCVIVAHMQRKGEGGPKDLVSARSSYQTSCNAGEKVYGCYFLAIMQSDGEGGPKDLVSARSNFQTSCNSGEEKNRCFSLGLMQRKGEGGPKDLVSARSNFQKSCNAGEEKDGCYFLAHMQSHGEGGPKDLVSARSNYQKSCNAGDEKYGCYQLAISQRIGEGGPKDLVSARSNYQTSCQAGYSKACNRLKQLQ